MRKALEVIDAMPLWLYIAITASLCTLAIAWLNSIGY